MIGFPRFSRLTAAFRTFRKSAVYHSDNDSRKHTPIWYRPKDWAFGAKRKEPMITMKFARLGLVPTVAMLAGLAVGCGHCQKCQQCGHGGREKSCTTCSNQPAAGSPYGAMAQNAPSPLPLATLPPVSNERYLPPDGSSKTVTAGKPNPDGAMLKPVSPMDRPADSTPVSRRSFPDITARAE